MFWIPSNKPLDWEWFKAAPARLQYQFSSVLWATEVKQIGQNLSKQAWAFIPLTLLLVADGLEASGDLTGVAQSTCRYWSFSP